MHKTIIGVFNSQDQASEAIDRFEAMGYDPRDLSIIMKDKNEASELGETGANVAEGAASGAAAGGVVGALAGLVSGTILPGLGAFLIGGPIATALGLAGVAAQTVSGAVTGVVAGGLIGALTSLGLSEEEAREYEQSVKEGNILMAVPSNMGEEDEVKDILEDLGATQVRAVEAVHSVHRHVEESGYGKAYASDIGKDKKDDK